MYAARALSRTTRTKASACGCWRVFRDGLARPPVYGVRDGNFVFGILVAAQGERVHGVAVSKRRPLRGVYLREWVCSWVEASRMCRELRVDGVERVHESPTPSRDQCITHRSSRTRTSRSTLTGSALTSCGPAQRSCRTRARSPMHRVQSYPHQFRETPNVSI